MITIIRNGKTVRTYHCKECGCVFTASQTDRDNISCLWYCPECGHYIGDNDVIGNQEISKEELFKKINVPSSWKIEDGDEKFEITCASATTDECNKRFE